jgi:phosphoribosylanthranilate isomerase
VNLRVKICGVRTVEEARQAAAAGADAVGLNFYRKSPRHLSPAAAEAIVAALPPFVTAVGLFVDAPAPWVRQVVERCRLGAVQLHGEGPGAGFGRPVIRALQISGEASLEILDRLEGDAILLDGHIEGLRGGTGRCFDWSLVAEARRRAGGRPIILAGGLTPETVAEAVRLARPDAVDVASGVESAPGVKDPDKVARFVRAAKGVPVGGVSL